MKSGTDNILQLAEKRVARLLDRAAEYHRSGELLLCLTALEAAQNAIDPRRDRARKFLAAWYKAVERESRGLTLPAPPKSWAEIAQEISAKAAANENYEECVESLTHTKIGSTWIQQRLPKAILGIFLFMIGLTAIIFVLHGALDHFMSYRLAQVAFFRRGVWLTVHVAATFLCGSVLSISGFSLLRRAMVEEPTLTPKFKLEGVPVNALSREE